MGITIKTMNKMIDKAKTKKDGVYSVDCWRYAVRDSGVVAYIGYKGGGYVIYGCFGGFSSALSEPIRWESEAIKRLKETIKKQRSSY